MFQPGTGFSYSTYGYTLASAVLEGASGQSFAALLASEVSGPADLPELALDPGPVQDGRAAGHVGNPLSEEGVLLLAEPSVSWKWAGGGMVASAGGLTTFATALMRGELLTDVDMTRMLTPVPGTSGDEGPDRYGLGWWIDTRQREAPDGEPYVAIHHGGTGFGNQSFLIMMPAANISAAVLINVSVGGSEAIAPTTVEIMDLFLPYAENPN